MASTHNFTIEKGSTFYMSFQYTNSEGTVINLTNYQARISIQPINSSENLITYISDTQNENYSLLVSGNTGTVTWQIPSSVTELFNFDEAIYDFDLMAPNEIYPGAGKQIIKLLKGNITLIKGNIANPEPFLDKELDDGECIICE
jgi:hypothetical protein